MLILNQCAGSCSFTYLTETNSPKLLNITKNGTTVSLNGTKFTTGTACSIALTNTITQEVTVVAATTCNATNATFIISPNITSGKYAVRTRSELGESNPLALNIDWIAGSQQSSSASTAGHLIVFTGGSGYPADLSNRQFSVWVRDSARVYYPAKVLSCCAANSITILAPPAPDNSNFNIYFHGPTGNNWVGAYTTSLSRTLTLTLASASTVPAGTNEITLNIANITRYNEAPLVSLALVSTKNPAFTVPVSVWSVNSSTTSIKFSASLPGGSYRFEARATYRYFAIAAVLNVNVPTTLSATAGSYSYNGGLFTITAAGLSPTSNIRVNGLRGDIVGSNQTENSITYRLPALFTPRTQLNYSLAKADLIDLSSATFFSDIASNSNVSASFDGSTSSYYGSSNSTCWIGIDFGSGVQTLVSRVRFFPSFDWFNTASKILHAKF